MELSNEPAQLAITGLLLLARRGGKYLVTISLAAPYCRPNLMSRLIACSVLAAVVATALLPARAQSPAPDPGAILAAARSATGPAPPAQNLEVGGAFRMQPAASGQQMQGKLVLRFLAPQRYQRSLSMRLPFGQIQTTQTLDGDTVWVHVQHPAFGGRFMAFRRGGQHMTAAEREQFRQRMQARQKRMLLAQWARGELEFFLQPPPGATLRYAGLAKARNGVTADMVAVSDPAWGAHAGPVTLFVDTRSHRLLMMSYQGVVPRAFSRARFVPPGRRPGQFAGGGPPGTKPRTVFVHFTHWRKIQGHWFPMEITRSANGKTFAEWDVQTVRWNSRKLTARVFQKP